MILKNKKGFTLIELLVVIAIIGVLSTVVLSQLNEARAKTRDARRISDLKNIQIALELYRDANGAYPLNTAMTSGMSVFVIRWNTISSALSPYINLPKDPVNTTLLSSSLWPHPNPTVSNSNDRKYFYNSNNGLTYDLVTNLETNHPLACRNVPDGYKRRSTSFIASGDYNGSVDTGWCDNLDSAPYECPGVLCNLYSANP